MELGLPQDDVEVVRVRKWRRELKPIGPGGHLEITSWVPEVSVPTLALQQSRQLNADPKGSSATTKKSANARKRAAADGSAARMTRSLRHNAGSGSELWGQLPPPSTRTATRGKEEKKLEIHMALDQGQHHYDVVPSSHVSSTVPTDTSAPSSKPTSPAKAASTATTPAEPALSTISSVDSNNDFLAGMIPYDGSADDDDDDEGYRTLSPSSSPEVSASPSPAASPI
ncbi:hypothetical protein SPRG_14184 [Saprolegnia parasitica CBS 223.65]|uniref:Uncharacterized protein n=1 Tax=Saprolegnia parasitica (strain CBS 223.65) TaxID=695850 RepID=A0A067C0E0_SAPPC|nr:hypothetical protein SPRG_14184 [Saprolegnia parasitica CBS 223.65]KDO20036.1 hypothetical protein SPRG_14184 [Saprolegnia parasitica CBS 223.65]|eukprot:XP_012209270.1 hypothetical protein SPRG_14184 [Saprolegnia parasitica CBS 223.65]